MKHIYVNLKRFDIPKELGGVNFLAPMQEWSSKIVKEVQDKLTYYENVEFAIFFPEAHLLPALQSLNKDSKLKVGCQSVYREDTSVGGNFGAFTSNRTANAMKAMGVTHTIIGHCEERNDKKGILQRAGINDYNLVNELLNEEIKCAQKAGLKVLYCIGETAEEKDNYQEVLTNQLKTGLKDVDLKNVVIAYEPVWAIGPGKTPPNAEYISWIGKFIKEVVGDIDIVYGGGLKEDNAKMLAGVKEIAGGLIALTRFQGDIGFYPEEYLKIVELYLGK